MRLTPNTTQTLAWIACWIAAGIAVGALLIIIGYVVVEGVGQLSWEFLSTVHEGGVTDVKGGILAAIVGTFYIIALTLILAVPLGVGAGIYLAEYAGDNWFTRIVRWVIESLAGIPSVVYGLFGFALFVTALQLSMSLIAGALTLAALVLPTIIRTTEEAIVAVPVGHREAGLALGATRWQTIRHAVLPGAMPGVVTGIILSVGRCVEESACLYLTIGTGAKHLPIWPTDQGTTLAVHLYGLAMHSNALEMALGAGVVLIIIILVINSITRWLSGRWMARMQGL